MATASALFKHASQTAVFSFLYLKKLKFQKYMSVLENFKNIPRSPYGGRQGSNVIFFLQICNEVPGEKKGGMSHPQRATGPCRPPLGRPTSGPSLQAPGGAVARGLGDRPLSPPQRATGPFFFSRDFVANLKKKKLHFGHVALWEDDRGIFLKYFKTDIYF